MPERKPESGSPAEIVLSAVNGSHRSKRNPEGVVARTVAESMYDPYGGNLAPEKRVVKPKVGPVNASDKPEWTHDVFWLAK